MWPRVLASREGPGPWVCFGEFCKPKLTTASALVLEEHPRKLPSFPSQRVITEK